MKCDAASCSQMLARRWVIMEDNSLYPFLTLFLQVFTIYRYQSQDTLPDRACRKYYFSPHNHKQIFGKTLVMADQYFTKNLIQEMHGQIVHRYQHRDKVICCLNEIIEGCRQMLRQLSTDCRFGNEHDTTTNNQLCPFTKFKA